MKLAKIVVLLAIVAGAVYFFSRSGSDEDKPQKVQKEKEGVRLEEKYGFTGEQALP